MKKLFCLLFVLMTINVWADGWVQKASVGTTYLSETASFSIGNKGYVCGGKDSSWTYYSLTSALWEYNRATDTWTQKANYGGGHRFLACAFALNGKGYVGLGADDTGLPHKDFWQYDPTTNTWTQKANFGGGKRNSSLSFAINNKGYIFGGGDTTGLPLNDIWEYNPVTDIWNQKTSCPCSVRASGISFSLVSKGYIGGGYSSTNPLKDFWEYNPSTDVWTLKDSIPLDFTVDNGYFSIGNYGYFTCGQTWTSAYITDLWQYNSILNQWITKASFIGASRDEPAFFSIGNHGYVGWGGKDGNPEYNDFYEYTPDSSEMVSVNEITDYNIATTVYPNPFTTTTTIKFEKQLHNATILITDEQGRVIRNYELGIRTDEYTIDMSNVAKGIYFYEVIENKNSIAKGKLEVQ